ncbi:hypothetical protein [Caudoviricetes sp.]|nr:hypothetical protein [Caudoviricetes sp.]
MNITDEKLEELSQLAERQLRLEQAIKEAEENLVSLKDNHKQLSEVLIPEAMMEVGMESFKLKDGTSISTVKFYSGSIKEENAEAAFQWLRETGNDSLIKREVKCQFGKGEDAVANKLVELLFTHKYSPTDKSSVHPMTLKSFIREQMEAGNPDFPAELFGAYVGNKTKIVPAKTASK